MKHTAGGGGGGGRGGRREGGWTLEMKKIIEWEVE